MGKIARNPQFYTVGIPQMFFHPVDDPDDLQAVDVTALARAYSGIVDITSGRVLNVNDRDTCFTPEQILENAYVGNVVSNSMGGEIKSTEHVASVEGRKEIDKIVLIRRSLEYTLQFDEMNKQNLLRFFAAQSVVYPTSELISAKTTARGTQSASGDFAEGVIEIVDNGFTSAGPNSSGMESVLTERLAAQGTEFTPHDIGGTPTYLAGVFYFLVGDMQRFPTIEQKLSAYRGKLLCGFFKYDAVNRKMALQPWPAGMDTAAYKYAATAFDNRVRVFTLTDAETVAGITTNDRVLDRVSSVPVMEIKSWAFNASTPVTHEFAVNMPKHIARSSVKVTVKGRRWNASEGRWVAHTEVFYDRPQAPGATNLAAPLYTEGGSSVFLDSDGSAVNYATGVITLAAAADFVTDSTDNNLETQDIAVTVSSYDLSNAQAAWTGTVWARHNDTLSTMRVNRGKPEVTGCALVVHQNNIGVSMLHLIPRCTMRPDGSIDFAKDDWEKGGFVLSCIKDDTAFLPNLSRRVRIPFGATISYKYRTVK